MNTYQQHHQQQLYPKYEYHLMTYLNDQVLIHMVELNGNNQHLVPRIYHDRLIEFWQIEQGFDLYQREEFLLHLPNHTNW